MGSDYGTGLGRGERVQDLASHVIVDDIGDVRDIKAPRGHVLEGVG
jgi:hypothetical protein